MSERKSLFQFLVQTWKDWGSPVAKLEKRKRKLEALKQELELNQKIKMLEEEIAKLKKPDARSDS